MKTPSKYPRSGYGKRFCLPRSNQLCQHDFPHLIIACFLSCQMIPGAHSLGEVFVRFFPLCQDEHFLNKESGALVNCALNLSDSEACGCKG